MASLFFTLSFFLHTYAHKCIPSGEQLVSKTKCQQNKKGGNILTVQRVRRGREEKTALSL